MWAIFRREFNAAFTSLFAYVYVGGYLIVTGLLFTFNNIFSASGSIASLVGSQTLLLVFLTPFISMRLFSDERRLKTDQLLLTSPVSVWSIVLGKVFSAWAVFLVMLLCTLPYIVIIAIFGTPMWGELICGYLGLFLLGAAFIAVGALFSSLTESPIIAVILSAVANLFLYLMDGMSGMITNPTVQSIFNGISITRHFETFTTSVLSPAATLFMVSFCALFIFLTVRVIEKRRWSEG